MTADERRVGLLTAGAVWLIIFLLVWLVEQQPMWVSALVGGWWVVCLYMFWLGTVGSSRY